MKIFDTLIIREADKTTIERQGITSLGLMERAATEAFLRIIKRFPDKSTVFRIFCGQGNNGGDGLVIARLLHNEGYAIQVEIVEEAGKPTVDFLASLEKLKACEGYPFSGGGKEVTVYIDALFGIGLSRELSDGIKQVIEVINTSEAFVIAIDVPSGMFMNRKTEVAVQSDLVLTFQFPKLVFYLAGNNRFINEVEIVSIGLDAAFLDATLTNNYFTDAATINKLYKSVGRYAHKGTQGHALIIGGSYGKTGAALLSARAALKSGCGLVTAYVPKCSYSVVQTAFPEAMVLTDGEEHTTAINYDIQPKAVGLGMGIGQHPETKKAIHDFLKEYMGPLVIDADGLNILADNKEWLQLLPKDTILTPHPKELERLIGKWADDFDKMEKVKAFSKEYNLVVVAKDAYTFVIDGENIHINSTGNSALATGGSGDVLAGIITGLLAQGYLSVKASIFGVYLHGLTADIAAPETSKQAFTASNIIDYLGRAYLEIEHNRVKK
jgi:hydroxyethylthiazole kinase-like uncharacterized protein yjeF